MACTYPSEDADLHCYGMTAAICGLSQLIYNSVLKMVKSKLGTQYWIPQDDIWEPQQY